MPIWVVIASFLVLCLVIVKLIQTVLSSKSSKKNKYGSAISKTKDGNVKILNRKRSKKQRSFDVATPQRSLQSNEEPSTSASYSSNAAIPSIESGDSNTVNKKLDKKKGKSKKKKATQDDATNQDNVPLNVSLENQSVLEEEGEWHTVRTKEQRREKKRQEPVESPPTSVAKQPSPVLSTPVYTSIPSMAKDIAPRFARAAGEEWQEGTSKRSFSKPSAPLVSRSPMVPAAVAESSQTSTKWPSNDVTVPDLWNNKTSSSVIGFPAAQASTWTPITSTKSEGLTWAQNLSNNWPSKPSSRPWEGTGSASVEPSEWSTDPKTEDWVHVSTPSPTGVRSTEPWNKTADVYSQGLRQWTEVRVSEQAASSALTKDINREKFLLEPEGISVSSLDPDDPWNIDTYEKEGDWSPPEATWCNSNEEWKVPTVPAKPQPTYFDESSDEEKATVVAPAPSTAPKTVVGISVLPAQNQNANKKARRRRRKKQVANAEVSSEVKEETAISHELSTTAPDVTDLNIKEESSPEPLEEAGNNEAWSTRTSKKKKSRVRKEE